MTHGVNWAKLEWKIIQYPVKTNIGGVNAHFTGWSVGMSAKNLQQLTSVSVRNPAFSFPFRRTEAFYYVSQSNCQKCYHNYEALA